MKLSPLIAIIVTTCLFGCSGPQSKEETTEDTTTNLQQPATETSQNQCDIAFIDGAFEALGCGYSRRMAGEHMRTYANVCHLIAGKGAKKAGRKRGPNGVQQRLVSTRR